ncbi:MAG: A/G-specific adenine glycosylase [Alkalibacterium sp.]|nr:A/G-specific adenine glycosylase [Alkalibacterium sp.]TVP90067.1 MAG: A/G-specific adenine glycosylase [Alkalibacterium sp.]
MWEEEKIASFQKTLLDWYDSSKRDLPWRQTSNPYYIWVSEIMLQQTQVDTVIPYYNRFITTLPTVQDLADADEDTLLKLWEGLGYYSRVRNMKSAAIQIVAEHNGVFPKDYKDIIKLKGIGPYTAGAVSSIAFNQPQPAVDGNVMRVLSRLFELKIDIGKASSRKVFEEMIRHLIDQERPGDFNQALMDLGATICTPKNYKPETSPIKEFNASYLNETWKQYPVKKTKKSSREEHYIVVAAKNSKGEYIFEKRGAKGVLSGMLTFIMINRDSLDEGNWKSFEGKVDELGQQHHKQLQALLKKEYGVTVKLNDEIKGKLTHVFSHLKWQLTVIEADIIDESMLMPQVQLIHPEQFEKTAFPVPTQKTWELLKTLTLF